MSIANRNRIRMRRECTADADCFNIVNTIVVYRIVM
jgi:hypothetical protein